jgi:drug/metabolite transporter (DMT)-like permease
LPQKGFALARRPLGPAAVATLVLLCASWGLQQVAVKLALPAFPPMIQMSLRSAGAFSLVLLWCLATRQGRLLTRDGSLPWGLLAGVLFALEFILIYVGLQWTGASRSAIFIYTAPFFVALGAHWLLPRERLGPLQWLGLIASFAGVAVALGTPAPSTSSRALLGDLMVLLAGALWGATTLVIKATPLRSTPPEKVLLYQLAVSALLGAVGAALAGETMGDVGALPFWALAYQTVWVAGITFVIWFRLLARYPAGPLQAGTSMTPVFGVLSAAFILDEPLSASLVLAAGLVVLGLVLVNRPRPEAPPFTGSDQAPPRRLA